MFVSGGLIVRDTLKIEVDTNYDYFQRTLSAYLSEHNGQYALLKGAAIIDFYEGPGEAYRAGLARFPDRIFSIQKVTEEVEDLGMMSLAIM